MLFLLHLFLNLDFVLFENLPICHFGASLARHMNLAKLLLVVLQILTDVHSLQHFLLLDVLLLQLFLLLLFRLRVALLVIPVDIWLQRSLEHKAKTISPVPIFQAGR